MPYRSLADLVVVVHTLFVVFVVVGGFLVLRWPRLVWAHVPALVWGVLIEYVGWICPLTPLENALRARGGEAGYAGGFLDRYLLPLLYPVGLTPHIQWVLGSVALGINVVAYALVLRRRRRARVVLPSAEAPPEQRPQVEGRRRPTRS
jgi:hypothetical protein